MNIERTRFENHMDEQEILDVAQQLEALVAHPAWKLFREIVTATERQLREDAFKGPREQFDYWKGALEGVHAPLSSVEAILAKARTIDKKEQKKGRLRQLDNEGDLSF